MNSLGYLIIIVPVFLLLFSLIKNDKYWKSEKTNKDKKRFWDERIGHISACSCVIFLALTLMAGEAGYLGRTIQNILKGATGEGNINDLAFAVYVTVVIVIFMFIGISREPK